MRHDVAMFGRALLLGVAVLVIGWLGIMERDTRLMQQAGSQLFRSTVPSRTDFARGQRLLRQATFLNPDTTPDLDRAAFAFLRGRPRAALAIAYSVARREPENISAWLEVLQSARAINPRRATEALAHIHRLEPLRSKPR